MSWLSDFTSIISIESKRLKVDEKAFFINSIAAASEGGAPYPKMVKIEQFLRMIRKSCQALEIDGLN